MNLISLITEILIIILLIGLLIAAILYPKNVLMDLPLGFIRMMIFFPLKRIYLILKFITTPLWLLLAYFEDKKIYSSWMFKKLIELDKWITEL